MENQLRKFIRAIILKESIDQSFSDDYDFSKHSFNSGDCDIYAVALHRLHGYPLYVVRGHFLEDEWGGEREWDFEDAHIVVKLPNGNFLDSSGESTEQEMKDLSLFNNKIEKITLDPISESEALETFSCQDQEQDVKQVMKYISSKENKSSLNEGAIWNQGGIILLKGEKTEDGTQRLYATTTKNILDLRPGVRMVILDDQFLRIKYDEQGELKGVRVHWKSEPSLAKMLNFKNHKLSVVINNNKTPFHWETLQFTNLRMVLKKFVSQILSINNIDFHN